MGELSKILGDIENNANVDSKIRELLAQLQITHIDAPNQDKLLNDLAVNCFQQKLFDYVIPLLQYSLEVNKTNIDTLYNLGFLLFQMGQLELALDYLNMIPVKDDEIKNLINQIEQEMHKKMPKVSVLIPAYNRPYYLELALKSVLNQTYKNIEIIICDDSTNDEVKDMITPYLDKYRQIRYYKNKERLLMENFYKCFDFATGDYINYLMDDDLFHEEKIEKMIAYFMQDKTITLVTSYRQLIDKDGKHLSPVDATIKLFEKDTKVNGISLVDYSLINSTNFIGEPTTVLFKKKDLDEQYGFYKGRQYFGVNDLATWIALLAKGNALYIAEPLSFFRQHPGQNQQSLDVYTQTMPQWLDLIEDAKKDGFLNKEADYKNSLLTYLRKCSNIMQLAINRNNEQVFKTGHDCCNKILSKLGA